MEPTTIFLILFALALVFIFSSSSNDEEHHPPREEAEQQNGHGQFYPRPDYPLWGSPPDWRDWQYDYYRRPRIYRVSSVFKAVATTFLACFILMAGIYIFTKVESTPSNSAEVQAKERSTENTNPLTLRVQKRSEVIKPAPKEYVHLPYHLCAKSRPLDMVTVREVQKFYPQQLEILRISEELFSLVVFTDNNEALDKFIKILRSHEDLKAYKLDFNFRKVTELCSGKIIRGKGTDIWFCQE